MPGFYTVYVWCLFLAALLSISLTVYALKQGDRLVSRPFATMMFFAAWWAFCAGLSAVSATVDGALFWGVRLRFIGVIFVVPTLLFFTLVYTGREQWLSRRNLIIILIIPGISSLLVFSYGAHDLFVYDVIYEPVQGYWLRTAWSKGIWFGVHTIFGYFLLAVSLIMLAFYAVRAKYPYRQQAFLVLFGASLPIFASIFATFDLLPGPDLDLTILGFVLMGFALAFSLFNYQMLNLLPFARDIIVEDMNDMVMVLDRLDIVVDVNASVEKALGTSRRQIIGQPAKDVFVPWVDFFEMFTNTQEANTVVMLLVDNQPVYLDMSISPLKRRGQFMGRLFVMRDVTHLKTTELALQMALRSKEALSSVSQAISDYSQLGDLLQTIVDMIATTLPADRVTLIGFDLDAEKVIHFVKGGPGSDNVVFVPYTELIDGLSGWVIKELKPALSFNGIPDLRESDEVRQRRKESFCGAILVVPLLYRENLLGTLTAINRPDQPDFSQKDVDLMQAMANQAAVAIENARLYEAERKRVKELQESNQALNAFARMVAHDLKNPLGLIVGYTELILMRAEENHDRISNSSIQELHMISQQGFKMSKIVDDLLLLASIRNKQDVLLTAVDMTAIVQEVKGRLTWQIEQKQATITQPESWPPALGFAPWVEEIWANYMSNALKYGGDPPVLALGGEDLGNGECCFWVIDNGIGLSEEQQRKLFKEFSRLAEHHDMEGSGLGLSIVEYIVRRLEGHAGVESETGKGSKFYFTLPSTSSQSSAIRTDF